ncbi:MAG: hypothetical protein ACOX9E_06105 [Lentisphaeria bacterium]|jgi:neutral ceramidase
MKVGFACQDITPKAGAHKIGWLRDIIIKRIADPLYARVAYFDNGRHHAVLIQLDTLCIRWTTTQAIRQLLNERYGIAGSHVLVAATHNHAGPAVANVGDVKRDDAYCDWLTAKVADAVGEAIARSCDAELGFGRCFEFRLSHNRRTALKNGLSVTHAPGFGHPAASHIEGPIDPEVAVLAARGRDGACLGLLLNFACHPTHHGGDDYASGGYPAALAEELAQRGCPHTLFFNGACGNISPGNPYLGINCDAKEIGRRLAEDAAAIMDKLEYSEQDTIRAVNVTIEVPVRRLTQKELRGLTPGAQRFIDPAIYERLMPALAERLRAMPYQPLQLQGIRVGELCMVGIPAEIFTEYGLQIKELAWPQNTIVISHANGMVGYVPTREAFKRGGYETTLGTSRLAPRAGDIIAKEAAEIVKCLRDWEL